jgi:rhodanese-related sulfurtransferase
MKSWKIAGVLLVALALGAFVAGQALAFGVKELDNEKLVVNFYNEVTRGGYKVVDTETLKKWADEKKPMLIVDTMPLEDSYKKQHIPGAVQMEFPIPELTQLDEAKKAEFEKLLGPDKAKLIVFYCGFPKCTRSHNGAMWAIKLGYTNVYRHPGGIKAWADADYPVASVK